MVKSVGEGLAIGAVTDHVRADGGLFLCIITLPLFAAGLQI
jgi:hypothetical protein